MLTNDTKLYLRRLHEEAQGLTPGSRAVAPEYQDLAHGLLEMFEVLLDPEQAAADFEKDFSEPATAQEMLDSEYENLRDDLRIFSGRLG